MSAQDRYLAWLENPRIAESTKEELRAIADDPTEITDRFYQDLQFGTAGLRGILGAGTNRMNYYTVARAAEAYAQTLAETSGSKERGIAISFDSRNYSPEFAELSARIFLKHGFKVYLFERLHPVPLLSFAIRRRNCAGGIMITASHNPREYNGFKVYSEDGSQLEPDAAERVAAKMYSMTDFPALLLDLPELTESENLIYLGEDLDSEYNTYLQGLIINKEAIKRQADLEIVYTPLYGTGYHPVCRALRSLGFKNISVVEEQAEPDGNFPTAPYPNPEVREALALGIELAEERGADLLLATDPDADRLGLAVRNNEGEFKILSGNQIGILLMDYILSAKAKFNRDNRQHFCVASVVSSRLPRLITANYGVKLYECLTGFKYVAEKIRDGLAAGECFDFGFEESFGYLIGDDVRDKDAVTAAAVVCEMAAVAAEEGQTLYERCEDLFAKYLYSAEKTVAFSREGKEGLLAIQNTVNTVRAEKEKLFSELHPVSIEDYQSKEVYYCGSEKVEPLDVNESNLMIYNLGQLDWFATRPSGTEPKLKVYMGAYRDDPEEAAAALAEIERVVVTEIENILNQGA
ncbi:MAG: phospho-sugar mutase [Eubacteriales bacterium]|nr:phospho-sugar mutase [Eubacteriales bacterium]